MSLSMRRPDGPACPVGGGSSHGMMSIADPPGNYGEDRYVDGSADARRDIVLETSQRTSRESRHLGQVIGWLTTEFGDRIDTDVIQRVAVEEITHLRKARVRSSSRPSPGVWREPVSRTC